MDPALALLEWMPTDALKSMAQQIPESEAETGKTGLPLIADAMARGLITAYQGIAEADNWPSLRAHLKMRDWICEAMDRAHREAIFGEFLRLYEEALTRHSEETVLDGLEEIPAEALVNLYLSLSENDLDGQPVSRVEKMRVLGEALGIGVRQLSLGAIHYGSELGLFPDRDFGLTPALKAQAGRLGPGPQKDFALVDANYFEMLRHFEGVPLEVASDWGSLHPLVRGFAQYYEGDPWVREHGVERIQQAVGEVEDFVTRPRH